MNVDAFLVGSIQGIKEFYHIEDSELVDCYICQDHNVYLLYSKTPPKRIKEMYVDVVANAQYYGIKFIVDWQKHCVDKQEFYDFGQLVQNYHFIRPLGDDFLLIAARCAYVDDNNFQKNARVINQYGSLLREFCLGDGIEDVKITLDERIVVSYFDEGIFGNYGWDDPSKRLGRQGLVIWDKFGQKVWENQKYDISDCYGMTIDSSQRVWFYYYSDFYLVCLDKDRDIVFKPRISGRDKIIISRNRLFINGGYDKNEKFYCFDIDYQNNKLLNKKKISLYANGKSIHPLSCYSYDSHVLFIGMDSCLYCWCFDNI